MITQDRVKELFDYREDGVLIWKIERGSAKKGSVAGCSFVDQNRKTRHCIKVDKKRYYTYRLIFLYHHGWLPKFIDHLDRDPSNNRLDNLRPATSFQQKGNIALQSNNRSGYRGVIWRGGRNKWQAHIRIERCTKSLGYFSNSKDAAKAYNAAALDAWGAFSYQNPL